MSKSVLLSVCLFICKTKLKTLTEWTVSGPSNVGSNVNNPSDINTTDVDFLFADTDLQALFDNDF
jgi:hypothetical protein